ncbi:hypothetical protein EVAR_64745_1 [Eumeta japonica]|uniref:Uncharacterized protein n=1 Tax=Eumeta variegata TaxID=151549 RepID=A0A4C1Z807_EUMVA|nr:hypothetical protein EVAR_64745_1 [Eumeta japonica]
MRCSSVRVSSHAQHSRTERGFHSLSCACVADPAGVGAQAAMTVGVAGMGGALLHCDERGAPLAWPAPAAPPAAPPPLWQYPAGECDLPLVAAALVTTRQLHARPLGRPPPRCRRARSYAPPTRLITHAALVCALQLNLSAQPLLTFQRRRYGYATVPRSRSYTRVLRIRRNISKCLGYLENFSLARIGLARR